MVAQAAQRTAPVRQARRINRELARPQARQDRAVSMTEPHVAEAPGLLPAGPGGGASTAGLVGGASAGLRMHGVLMIAEDGLDCGDGGREPAGLAADDRCDPLGGIAAPLGPDADGVPSDVGQVLAEGFGGAFQPSPGPANQAGDYSGGRLPGQAGRATPPG